MLARFDDRLIRFILRERRAALPAYLVGRLRHALIKGTRLDERGVSLVKRAFWIGLVLIAIFGTGAIETFLGTNPLVPQSGLSGEFFLQTAMALFAFLLWFIMHVVLIGRRNKDRIPPDASIPPFDLQAAKSGGVWGVAGLGLYALFRLVFGE
jgi:hypothetical protein